MVSLQPATWRVLGLSVAAGYTGFGLMAAVYPLPAWKRIFAVESANPEVNEVLKIAGPLIGVRDLSIGASLFALAHAGRNKEMGLVILGGMILCIADTVIVGLRRGWTVAATFAGGVAIWAGIGIGLLAE